MKPKCFAGFAIQKTLLAMVLLLAFCAGLAFAQVNPAEILNPDLKALEQTYFQQLIAINRSPRPNSLFHFISAAMSDWIPRSKPRLTHAAWNSCAFRIA